MLFVAPLPGEHAGGATANTQNFMASDAFRMNDVRVVDVAPPSGSYSSLRRAVHSVKLFGRLARQLMAHRPEAVYLMASSHIGFYEKALMALGCRAAGAGTILHLIGGGFEQFAMSSSLHRALVPRLLRSSTIVACVGTPWAEFVERSAPGARVRLLRNPVDASQFQRRDGVRARPSDSSEVRFVCVGLLIEAKGTLDLLDACAFAKPELAGRARVTLAGGGPLLEKTRERIRELDLADFVDAIGYVSEEDKRRLLVESDVFVMPSHAEGIPVAMLEAMSAGLPVIATSVGAVQDAVTPETGILVPARRPRELAAAMTQMVSLGEERIAIGNRARDKVMCDYDVAVTGAALSQLWAEAARLR